MTDINAIKARMKQLDETHSAADRASGDLRDVLKMQTLEIVSEIHGDAIASIRALLEQREADQTRIEALEAALTLIGACNYDEMEAAHDIVERALED